MCNLILLFLTVLSFTLLAVPSNLDTAMAATPQLRGPWCLGLGYRTWRGSSRTQQLAASFSGSTEPPVLQHRPPAAHAGACLPEMMPQASTWSCSRRLPQAAAAAVGRNSGLLLLRRRPTTLAVPRRGSRSSFPVKVCSLPNLNLGPKNLSWAGHSHAHRPIGPSCFTSATSAGYGGTVFVR